jgi:hypothetical protein
LAIYETVTFKLRHPDRHFDYSRLERKHTACFLRTWGDIQRSNPVSSETPARIVETVAISILISLTGSDTDQTSKVSQVPYEQASGGRKATPDVVVGGYKVMIPNIPTTMSWGCYLGKQD